MALAARSETVQFPVDASAWTRGYLRFLLALVLVAHIVNVILLAQGLYSSGSALAVSIFLVVGPCLWAINDWLMRRGVAELTDSRLEVRTRASKQLYRWQDILDVQVRTYGRLGLLDRSWATLLGLKADRRFVEITLRRSERLGIIPGLFGTDIPGVPLPTARTVRLHISDPDGFVRAASDFLRASQA